MMMLYREGCDELQGYHISPPLDSHGIERFIAGYTTRMQLGGSGQ
jgi:EAL domain-containing protein (putative c-di-GMP-specific phosphodiesterase class I)